MMAVESVSGTLLERAREIDAHVRRLVGERNRSNVQVAYLLLELREAGGEKALGYASISAYAGEVLGFASSKTSAFISFARMLGELPEIAAAAEAGELPWTKLRAIATVATEEDEGEWLEKARSLSARELEVECSEARGEEPEVAVAFKVSQEGKADIDDAVRAIRKDSPELSFGQAIAEACRRSLAGSGAEAAGGSRFRVVVDYCPECKTASRASRDGRVELSREKLDRIACDAEVLDIRQGPARITRTVPPKVRNFIAARDKGRCRVPRCPHRTFVDVHHEGGYRRVGHDPEHALLLCSGHHDARHEGLLRIEGRGPGMRFFLKDGSEITSATRETALC